MASSVDPSVVDPKLAVARPASAVVPLRDGPDGLEVLVGQRTAKARFMASFWVFPGGRVDEGDGPGDTGSRRAGAREVFEEVGIEVDPDTLVPFGRWVTPEVIPIRFDTVFYLAEIVGDPPVRIDGEEIVDSRWAAPQVLYEEAMDGRTVVAFPTLRQLEELTAWSSAADAMTACAGRPLVPITPVITAEDGDPVLRITAPDGTEQTFRDDPGLRNEATSAVRTARPPQA